MDDPNLEGSADLRGYNDLLINDAESENTITWDYSIDGLKKGNYWRETGQQKKLVGWPNRVFCANCANGGRLSPTSLNRSPLHTEDAGRGGLVLVDADWVTPSRVELSPTPGICDATQNQVDQANQIRDSMPDSVGNGKLRTVDQRWDRGGEYDCGPATVKVALELRPTETTLMECTTDEASRLVMPIVRFQSPRDGGPGEKAVDKPVVTRIDTSRTTDLQQSIVKNGRDAMGDCITVGGTGLDGCSTGPGGVVDTDAEK